MERSSSAVGGLVVVVVVLVGLVVVEVVGWGVVVGMPVHESSSSSSPASETEEEEEPEGEPISSSSSTSTTTASLLLFYTNVPCINTPLSFLHKTSQLTLFLATLLFDVDPTSALTSTSRDFRLSAVGMLLSSFSSLLLLSSPCLFCLASRRVDGEDR